MQQIHIKWFVQLAKSVGFDENSAQKSPVTEKLWFSYKSVPWNKYFTEGLKILPLFSTQIFRLKNHVQKLKFNALQEE